MDNSKTTNSWSCLKIPGINLPFQGVIFSTFLLQLLVVFVVTQTLHRLIFSRFHITPVVSQMFAGLILGPHMLAGRFENIHKILGVVFPPESRSVSDSAAVLAYMMFLFLISVKMDYSIILKTGRKAFVIGILELIVPVIVDLGFLAYLYSDAFHKIGDDPVVGDLYINLTTLPLTHFPNVAVFLTDMKMVNSELGRLALSSSLIGHILSVSLIAITNVVRRPMNPMRQILLPLSLIIVSIFILRPAMKWMIKQTPKGKPISEVFLLSVFLFMLLGAFSMQHSGHMVLLGAFIVGTVVPDGPPLGSAMVEKFEFLVWGMLLPFFVTTSVMAVDIADIRLSNKLICHHISLAILAFLSKTVVCLLCGLCNNMAFDDSLALSFIMCTKGIMDIGVLSMFAGGGILSRPSHSVMVLWAVFIATISPIWVRTLYHPLRKYAGYQRRDIMHCKFNSELRILACVTRSDTVNPFTRLLTACCPCEPNPVIIHALHLVKLVGRVHPAFIAHDTQKKSTTNSYSDDVIRSFRRLEKTYKGFLSVHVFTAVTPPASMHEDTCTLALDKLVSLILLPFHRRFQPDGAIDFDDPEQRALNSSLLDKSPCSVGILVDRGSATRFSALSPLTSVTTTESDSPITVAVVYVGGPDDQETLAFAKRIGRDSRVRVVVVRLLAFGQTFDVNSVDSVLLNDIEENEVYSRRFTLTEKMVKDGADTAVYLRSIIGNYDLMMVGRHYNYSCSQFLGLKDMNEDTELGAIGDFLASPDLNCKTSLLVMQQQRQWAWK